MAIFLLSAVLLILVHFTKTETTADVTETTTTKVVMPIIVEDPNPAFPKTPTEIIALMKAKKAAKDNNAPWPSCGARSWDLAKARANLTQRLQQRKKEIDNYKANKTQVCESLMPKDAISYLVEGCFAACKYRTNTIIKMALYVVQNITDFPLDSLVVQHNKTARAFLPDKEFVHAFDPITGSFYYGTVMTSSSLTPEEEFKINAGQQPCDINPKALPLHPDPLYLFVWHNCTVDSQHFLHVFQLPQIYWNEMLSHELHMMLGPKRQLCEEIPNLQQCFKTLPFDKDENWLEFQITPNEFGEIVKRNIKI